MKNFFKRSCLALVFSISLAGFAATAADDSNREADHAALRALRDRAAQAIGAQDIKALSSCFASNFAFTTVNQSTLTNAAQMQEFFDRTFRSDKAFVTGIKTEPQADIPTRFIDANTGVCYGSSKDTYTMKSGKVVELNVRWSATVVKENGEWKIAIAHVGTDFLNNPVLDGVKSFGKTLTAGAGVGGLVIGLLIGLALRPKPAPKA